MLLAWRQVLRHCATLLDYTRSYKCIWFIFVIHALIFGCQPVWNAKSTKHDELKRKEKHSAGITFLGATRARTCSSISAPFFRQTLPHVAQQSASRCLQKPGKDGEVCKKLKDNTKTKHRMKLTRRQLLDEPYLTLNYEYYQKDTSICRLACLQAGIIAMNAHGINRCES